VKITTTGPTAIRGSYTAVDECGNVSAPYEFTASVRNGLEACSVGYWKNHHEEWWPSGLSPDMLFLDVFQITDLSSPQIPAGFDVTLTLGEAAAGPGGTFSSALAEGTTAMLNAAYRMEYPLSVSAVRRLMQKAFAGVITFNEANDRFMDGHTVRNECGCPPQRN